MAKKVLKDAKVIINGVDLSDHVSGVTITTSRPEVDVTSMGASFQEFIGGIPDATVEVAYFQDFASGKVDATHWPLANSDTPFSVSVKSESEAGAVDNPTFFMMGLLLGDYNPIAGDVGSALTTTVTYRNAAQSGIVRHTT